MIPDTLPHAWPPEYPLHDPISAELARSMDSRASAEFRIPSLVLMEHAARGIAAIAAQLAPAEHPVHILCGPGNNGGDGYGCARFLIGCGFDVQTWRCAPVAPSGGDAGHEFALLSRLQDPTDACTAPERLQDALQGAQGLVVDALFGVGLTRPLDAPYLGWIDAANEAPGLRLAVDVPSGLESDTGEALPRCIQADVTATMAAPKLGFAVGATAVGHVVEIDIGLPAELHRLYLRESGL